jgi:hypothetical protein
MLDFKGKGTETNVRKGALTSCKLVTLTKKGSLQSLDNKTTNEQLLRLEGQWMANGQPMADAPAGISHEILERLGE